MQNKPNFPELKMSTTFFSKVAYENKHDSTLSQNKPNSDPICEKPKMNVNSILTTDYKNIRPCGGPTNKPNSKPIPQKPKMNLNSFLTKHYPNQPLLQTPENKAKQTEFQNVEKLLAQVSYCHYNHWFRIKLGEFYVR
jgi:hypothetical protein